MRMRRQTYSIDGISCRACIVSIEQAIKALPGVHEVSVDFEHRSVTASYDLRRVNSERIEEMLELSGYPVVAKWWQRLKLGMIHYTECNLADNLSASQTDCCTNPTKIYRQQQ